LDCANPEQLKRLLKVAVPEYQFSVPVEKKSQPAPVPPTHEPSRRAKPAEPEEVALAQL
jgi:hypothetical protein